MDLTIWQCGPLVMRSWQLWEYKIENHGLNNWANVNFSIWQNGLRNWAMWVLPFGKWDLGIGQCGFCHLAKWT